MLNQVIVKGTNRFIRHEDLKYIHLFGVELEGGWEENPEKIIHDGSVEVQHKNHNCHAHAYHIYLEEDEECDECMSEDPEVTCRIHCPEGCDNPYHCRDDCRQKCKCIIAPLSNGECASPKSTLDQLRGWIANTIPDKVNESCGLHVHVSLKKDGYYSYLIEKEFYNFFIEWFKKWGKDMNIPENHPYWSRLFGKNEYCHANFVKCSAHNSSHTPEEQINQQSKERRVNPHRYAILNFAYRQYKTMECRMFPGFDDPAMVMAAVESLAMCIEEYLEKHKPVEEKVVSKVYVEAI